MSLNEQRHICAPDEHHWVSTHVPGLLNRWVIQCSLCCTFNVDEMNEAVCGAAESA